MRTTPRKTDMTPNEHLDRIRKTAIESARAAGAILLRLRNGPKVVHAEEARDIKLLADLQCEETILGVIRREFPHHAVLAEESGASDNNGEYTWHVDPLDGTVNYYYGLPYYDVSVACYRRGAANTGLGEPIVGVVYAPPTDELFVAVHGRGATCNGKPVHATVSRDLADVAVCLGFGKSAQLGDEMAQASVSLAERVRKLRCFGAAGYDLANVAAGRLGAFYERGLRTWDIAAGLALLTEAGGRATVEELEPTRWQVLASGANVHDALRELLWTD